MKLPGDISKKQLIEQIIRVNHAGEYGAKRIYQGQLLVLKNSSIGTLIQHMSKQEEHHLSIFEKFIPQNRVRPSILLPFWHISGYMLGVASALLGKKAAMACTEAVEEVIDEHYAKQILALDMLNKDSKRYDQCEKNELDLKEYITQFRLEEIEHKNIAINNQSKDFICYNIFHNLIKKGCKMAIRIAKIF